MRAPPSDVRILFRSALLLLVITVGIGILDGTGIWAPSPNVRLTHVRAGILGWVALSVFGAAIWMLGARASKTRAMTLYAVVAMAAYVLAFWTVDLTAPTTIQRPIAGTLAVIAVVWVLAWAVQAKGLESYDVAEMGMVLALLFLVVGTVLGFQFADLETLPSEWIDRIAGSHPGAMTVGFAVLASLALIEWLIQDGAPAVVESKAGAAQMLLVFIAGVSLVAGVLADMELLVQLSVPIQVLGLSVLFTRHGRRLTPSQWVGATYLKQVRTAVLGLVAVVALHGYLVFQPVGDAGFGETSHVSLAMDHITFILVITGLIFAMMSMASKVSETANRVVFWGSSIGVIGFAIGLLLREDPLKRISTLILGLALLHGIFTYLTAKDAEPVESAAS